MPPELAALIDNPLLLAALLAVGAMCGVAVERFAGNLERERRREYWRGRNHGGRGIVPFRPKARPDYQRKAPDAADQLRCVMDADFTERPLLNKSEAAVFKALDAAVIARNSGWQVMAQVSLGEFLASKDSEAFLAVNSKRVDFALMDENAHVRHALEYQGTGHHQPGGAAAARDAVKKEALRKAGIGYHEVVAGHTTPGELKRLVERLVPGV
jgi:Protein of unknown function (DUF2726)